MLKLQFLLSLSSVLKLHWVGPGLLLLFSANSSHAVFYPPTMLPVISGSSGWEASIDRITWTPARGSYPNPAVPVRGSIPMPESLMWYEGAGNTDGRSGPDSVYFRYTLPYILESDELVGPDHIYPWTARTWVAADDWMHLTVNGHSVVTYALDEHKLSNGRPIPLLVQLTPFLNTHGKTWDGKAPLGDGTGINTFVIEAHDGGALPYDRGHEFVFFDAQHTEDYLYQISFIPEPKTYTMLLGGFTLVVLMARRRLRPL